MHSNSNVFANEKDTHLRYLSYEKRLDVMELIKLSDRRKINSICFMIRIFQSNDGTHAKSMLNNALFDAALPRRRQLLFSNVRRYAVQGSPLFSLMEIANEFHKLINLDEPIHTNRKRLKNFMAMALKE